MSVPSILALRVGAMALHGTSVIGAMLIRAKHPQISLEEARAQIRQVSRWIDAVADEREQAREADAPIIVVGSEVES